MRYLRQVALREWLPFTPNTSCVVRLRRVLEALIRMEHGF